MYLSPSDIQHTRIHTIDNLHAASRAWVEATERLSELALRAGRLALDEGRELHVLFAAATSSKSSPKPAISASTPCPSNASPNGAVNPPGW